jgi:hypothetical protein
VCREREREAEGAIQYNIIKQNMTVKQNIKKKEAEGAIQYNII